MQKKLAVIMMFLMSIMVFANETVKIEKEVTGVDRQILETSDTVEDVEGIQEGQLQPIDVNLKSNDLKTTNETLMVEQEEKDSGLEDELAQGMSSDKSWLKYILGAVLLIAGVAAF